MFHPQSPFLYDLHNISMTQTNSKLQIPYESPLNLQNITDIVPELVYRDET